MFLTDLQIAGRNLAKHTKRNLFLGGAIAAVTALLVLMGGLTAGIRGAMLESATILMTGHVNVGGFFKITAGTGAPIVNDFPKALEDARRAVPEIELATARVRGYGKVVSDTASMDLVLSGIDLQSEPMFQKVIRVTQGKLDDLAQPNTILLFEDQAKRLGVRAGDALTISSATARGANNTADLRVAAVAKNIGILSSFTAFMPAVSLRELYQLKTTATGAIHLYLEDPERSGEVAARLRTALAADGWRVMDPDPQAYFMKFQRVNSEDWTGQKIDITTWEDELSFLSWILTGLNGLTGLLITVLLVIIVIGIANTLAIAIRERTREIGTLRAIGMQRRKVLWLFLLEASLLGLASTVAGAVAGSAVAALLNVAHLAVPESVQMFLMQQHLTVTVGLRPVLNYVLGISAVTTLAALYPAYHAARLRPITAIHHIG
jgi:ABC-type lipoprotein release transport system permease subunit